MEQSLQLPSVASTSNLNKIHETSAKFQRYKILLRRHWWFLLLTAAIGVCVQALRITGKPDEYISEAKLIATGKVFNADSAVVYQEYIADFYGTIIETLQSPEMRRQAIDRVTSHNPDITQAEVEIRVVQNKGSAIFNVSAIGADQKYTKIFLDALIDEYVGFRAASRQEQSNQALIAMRDDLIRKEAERKQMQDRLMSFNKANDMIVIAQGHNEAAEVLRQRTLEADELRMQQLEAELTIKGVDAALQERQRGSIDSSQNRGADTAGAAQGKTGQLGFTPTEADYIKTKRDILLLKAEKDQLMKVLKPLHPDVLQISDKIEREQVLLGTLDRQIVDEMRSQLNGIKNKIVVIELEMERQRKSAKEASAKISESKQLNDELMVVTDHYKKLSEKVTDFKQDENIATDNITIQSRASAAIKNAEGLTIPILIGLAGGLGIGIIILLLFDRMDDRMNSLSEFQALFPEEQILGQIPDQGQRGDVALLRSNDDRHLYAEAFRNVRSSILFKNWKGKPPKTILLTSAVPNEGKTTVTSNLATTMALAGARVLLADCDLRRGGVSELFKLPVSPGLSEVLRGKTHWRDAVQETSIRNLDLLARGEVFDQTSEMLLSRTTDEILKEMSEEYDYVIFDSAPVLVADDTASFAPKVDAVLFVVRMSSTMARLSGKAMGLLYDRQVPMGGVILNRSSSSLKEYTYYNYASYYYTPKPQEPGAS
jgi:polysaccharide biosynthesis transport protein